MIMDKDIAQSKKENLIAQIKSLESLLVAFSGGVDSTFLLAVAHQTLKERAIAATASSEIHLNLELKEASDFTRKRDIKHVVFPSDEMSLPVFVSNGPDRCYHCKRNLFDSVFAIAKENDITHVAHGANLDDLNDYRPGFRAAKETGVIAPLIDAGLNKEEIRFLSREMGLSTWNKPAMPCLATRIPYESLITSEKLKMIEQAETFLLKQGFTEIRVRHHGSIAKIEVNAGRLKDILNERIRKSILEKFREIGFEHIALDLEGYVSGKMNRSVKGETE
jgi:uncharacterized protein